jgi:hypothetical protein
MVSLAKTGAARLSFTIANTSKQESSRDSTETSDTDAARTRSPSRDAGPSPTAAPCRPSNRPENQPATWALTYWRGTGFFDARSIRGGILTRARMVGVGCDRSTGVKSEMSGQMNAGHVLEPSECFVKVYPAIPEAAIRAAVESGGSQPEPFAQGRHVTSGSFSAPASTYRGPSADEEAAKNVEWQARRAALLRKY